MCIGCNGAPVQILGSLNLAPMANGLIEKDESCPDLTALTEGTVAAIFSRVRYHIEDCLG